MIIITAGAIYFIVMSVRLIAGLTVLAHSAWFGAYLPAIFHLVLAAYVLGVGHYLCRHAVERSGS